METTAPACFWASIVTALAPAAIANSGAFSQSSLPTDRGRGTVHGAQRQRRRGQ